jgi:hypothetical protein
LAWVRSLARCLPYLKPLSPGSSPSCWPSLHTIYCTGRRCGPRKSPLCAVPAPPKGRCHLREPGTSLDSGQKAGQAWESSQPLHLPWLWKRGYCPAEGLLVMPQMRPSVEEHHHHQHEAPGSCPKKKVCCLSPVFSVPSRKSGAENKNLYQCHFPGEEALPSGVTSA